MSPISTICVVMSLYFALFLVLFRSWIVQIVWIHCRQTRHFYHKNQVLNNQTSPHDSDSATVVYTMLYVLLDHIHHKHSCLCYMYLFISQLSMLSLYLPFLFSSRCAFLSVCKCLKFDQYVCWNQSRNNCITSSSPSCINHYAFIHQEFLPLSHIHWHVILCGCRVRRYVMLYTHTYGPYGQWKGFIHE